MQFVREHCQTFGQWIHELTHISRKYRHIIYYIIIYFYVYVYVCCLHWWINVFIIIRQRVAPVSASQEAVGRRQQSAGGPDDDADHLADGVRSQVAESRVAGQASVHAERYQRVDGSQPADVPSDVRCLAADTAQCSRNWPPSTQTTRSTYRARQ